MSRTIKDIQKDIELLGVKGGYSVEQLLTPQDCRRLSYEIDNETRQLECYKADLENANEIIAELQARIDKAIEYIEEYKASGMGEEWFKSSTPISYLTNTLKGLPTPEEILKGSDKE